MTATVIPNPFDLIAEISGHVQTRAILLYIYGGFSLAITVIYVLRRLLRSRGVPTQQQNLEEQWIHQRGLPTTQTQARIGFRLPVNDPRYMAEKQASFKAWRV